MHGRYTFSHNLDISSDLGEEPGEPALPPPLFWVKPGAKIAEGRKAGRASKPPFPPLKVWIRQITAAVFTFIDIWVRLKLIQKKVLMGQKKGWRTNRLRCSEVYQ